MCTAATWFHRFYMRYSMSDFHRQVYRSSPLKIPSSPSWKDVAATCIFLATKTEECGRKLKDVARICQAKVHSTDVNNIPADGKVRWAVTIAWLLWIGSFLGGWAMSSNYSLHRRSTPGGNLLWFCYWESSFTFGWYFQRCFDGWPSARVRMEHCTWFVSSGSESRK